MITGWVSLFRRGLHYVRHRGRSPTPQLTSLENPEKYLHSSPSKRRQFFSVFADTPKTGASSSHPQDAERANTEFSTPERRPAFDRMTSDAELLGPREQRYQSFLDTSSSNSNSRSITPMQDNPNNFGSFHQPLPPRRLSQIQPGVSPNRVPRAYTPMREAPAPPSRISTVTSASINIRYTPSVIKPRASRAPSVSSRVFTQAASRANSTKARGMISAPIKESFTHVDGAFLQRSGSRASERGGPLGLHPVQSDDEMNPKNMF